MFRGGSGQDWVLFKALTRSGDAGQYNDGVVVNLADTQLSGVVGTYRMANWAAGVYAEASGFENIVGSDGNDTLIGGAGADTFEGGLGADSITGNGGVDSIEAGDGNDTVVADETDFLLDGGNNTDLLKIGVNFADVSNGQIINFENVELTADGLTVSLNDQTENLVITGFATGASTIVSGAGHDTITGGVGSDYIEGANGNDVISGLGGADTLDGGAGNDDITIGTNTSNTENVNVWVYGGSGNDIIKIELDAAKAFRAVDRIIQSGQDARRFLEDLRRRPTCRHIPRSTAPCRRPSARSRRGPP